MLPRVFRLQKSKDIKTVIEKGARYRGRHLQLSALHTNGATSRFAFIVSNKISKKATVRNRAKRLMREATRSLLPQINSGYDIIVWASYGIEKGTKALIQEELLACLKNMNIVSK